MKIVIEIPEQKYKWIEDNPQVYISELDEAVRNGIPLPKRHGRLIDYGYVVDAIDDWINAEEYCYSNATDYLRNRIRNVPTIIEADKEQE